ncbi:MAG: hypothetical protein HZA17_11010 [Nitrospirae bacterium]|nr:hypothetical protein [Nitrospirota bacterium]
MKKGLILVVALMLVMAGMAIASTISSTKHNLSASGGQTVRDAAIQEICVFCHTPHASNSGMTAAPLWNRAANTTGWNGGAYSTSTMNDTSSTAATASDVSKACLGCHDGAIGDETLVNGPGSGLGSVANITGNMNSFTNLNDANGLANDHPIGVNVTGNTDTDIVAPTNANVRLFGGLIECASCHLVHDNTNAPFLAMTNAGSQMCLQCHNK